MPIEMEHLAVELDRNEEEENYEEFPDTDAAHVDVNSLHHGVVVRPRTSHATSCQLDDKGSQVQDDKDHGEHGGFEDAYSTIRDEEVDHPSQNHVVECIDPFHL